MQTLVIAVVVAWAAWHVFGTLAPWRQRRVRAALARRLSGRLPERALARLRPGPLQTGCGCGTGRCETGPSGDRSGA